MFNDYANHVPWSAYLEAFSEIKLPVVLPKAAFKPRDDICADRRRANRPPCRGKGRIAFPPARPKEPPVINFRSEGRRFERGRCLVPASWFYEFRGDKVPKEKWKFTKRGEDWF